MSWKEVSGYAEVNTQGTHSVCWAKTLGGLWQYQAWRIADKAILHTGAKEDCRAACERDSEPGAEKP